MEILIRKEKSLIPLRLLAILFFLAVSLSVTAQTETQPLINPKLNGIFIDKTTKQPIPGAVVRIKGTTHAFATDEKGELNFVTGQKFPYTSSLVLWGIKTQEFTAKGSPVQIVLAVNIRQLNAWHKNQLTS